MSSRESFFGLGPARDRNYVEIRDNPDLGFARRFVEELWAKYRPLSDRHFLADSSNHFLQRFWEMYLAITLKEHGLAPIKVRDEGPEFYFLLGEKKVWIEAVAPGPGTGPDAVPHPPLRRVFRVPQEQILLRFTNALAEKLKQYNAALKKRIVDVTDHYVVAINCRGIPHALYGSVLPFGVMAFLPFGDPAVTIDKEQRRIVDSYFEYRGDVVKGSGAAVPTNSFLDPQYAGISGVLHSAVYPTAPLELGGDFWFLHNPFATQPVDRRAFSFCRQYFFRDGMLQIIESARPLAETSVL